MWWHWAIGGGAVLACVVVVRTVVQRAIESATNAKAQALTEAYEREVKAEAERRKAAIDRRVEEKATRIDKMNAAELDKEFNE